MILRRHLFLFLIATILLAGCETGNFIGGQSEGRAEALARNGEHADAAAVYI